MVVRRFMAVVALATIAVQLTLTASAAISVCIDGPHTHNGRPAPDCPMHHAHNVQQSEPAAHEHHHHHSGTQTDSGAQVSCGCSADLPGFLIVGTALVSGPVSVAEPASTRLIPSVPSTSPLERFTTPFTPPPRPLSA